MMKIVKNPRRRDRSSKADPRLTGPTTRQIRYVEKKDVERLFNAIPVVAVRDALLFDILYRYGLRREEATLILREHVRDRIWITRVKGGVSREYPIFDRTRRLLWSYLSQLKDDGNPHLFPSPQTPGVPLSTSLIYQLFQMYAEKAELPADRRFPHVFRHSIAVHLLNAGWDLIDVQHWLGHASIASTQVYARVSNLRLERKFKALRPSEIAAL